MMPFSYGIIGVGGYAGAHLASVLELQEQGEVRLCAVAEPFQDANRATLDELSAKGIRIYDDYRRMIESEALDIVSVPTPIPLHVPMATAALESGAHVMLEKPPAVLVQQVDELTRLAEDEGLLCQVGFQNIADPAARELKTRLLEGEIGRIRELVVVGMWRRTDAYYQRAGWAGKVRLGEDWVLDGPVNNPLIHYMHEALFLAGPEENTTRRPLSVQAELYRAHPIEGEDIVCARAELEGGATMHSYLTLCALTDPQATVEMVGERGRALWSSGHCEIEGPRGRSTITGVLENRTGLFANLLRALRGEEELWSPISATRNIILHNNGCYKSTGKIRRVPERFVKRPQTAEGDTATEVDGLVEAMTEATATRRLLSEVGVEWAVSTPRVKLDFDEFDPTPLLDP